MKLQQQGFGATRSLLASGLLAGSSSSSSSSPMASQCQQQQTMATGA